MRTLKQLLQLMINKPELYEPQITRIGIDSGIWDWISNLEDDEKLTKKESSILMECLFNCVPTLTDNLNFWASDDVQLRIDFIKNHIEIGRDSRPITEVLKVMLEDDVQFESIKEGRGLLNSASYNNCFGIISMEERIIIEEYMKKNATSDQCSGESFRINSHKYDHNKESEFRIGWFQEHIKITDEKIH